MFRHHGTSVYGTTPDAILFKKKKKKTKAWEKKKKKIYLKNFTRICLMNIPPHTGETMISDHDALSATFW